jgi:hypothetical protein
MFISVFIQQSVSRQFQSLFQSQLSTQCDLELSPSDVRILSFPLAHPVDSNVFFSVFLLLLSFFYLSFNNLSQKAVSTQNVTNPVSLPFAYFM